jgi:hypothetical protein
MSTTNESKPTAMQELIEEMRGMRGDFRTVLTKLFGDDKTENEHGRIPRLESVMDNHEKRIGALEELVTKAGGMKSMAGWAVAGLLALGEIAYHVVTIYNGIKGN